MGPWFHCRACDVKWQRDDPCWSCGAIVPPATDARPIITSGAVLGAMSDTTCSELGLPL